jgi:hypothetical protein
VVFFLADPGIHRGKGNSGGPQKGSAARGGGGEQEERLQTSSDSPSTSPASCRMLSSC